MSVSYSKLYLIAQTARENCLSTGEDTIEWQDYTEELPSWPDCYSVSRSIKHALINQTDIDHQDIFIAEYVISEPYTETECHHYVLKLQSETSNAIIIDASHDQFANETTLPVSIGSQDTIEPILITSEEKYPFNECPITFH